MITGISRFKLRPGLTKEKAIEEIHETIPVYKGRPGLVRKYICLNFEEGYGMGIYLWENRADAEKFYAFARAKIKEQTGSEPEITLLDTPVIVDNVTGEVMSEK
ncbi:MAG TPA: hypothetical protein P5528_09895 [Steroidobacteraceae bacterium]|nr:hypothetical protein [Steroidobacteraceae bacterium]HRX89746.1 hypothetical protein [Steroidobacteraceae bacterium]